MRYLRLTREVAWWAARDAGSRNAREHGRKAWNEEDLECCAVEFDRLWPLSKDLDDPQPQALQFLEVPTV